MAVAVLLVLTVFLLGPTAAIIDTLTNTLGSYLSEIVRMSLRATRFRDSSWVGSWTVFYWAWSISWSPFVGLFIARVSRGRTMRELILGTVQAPSLAAFIWFSIFGGTALYMEIWQHMPLAAAVKADMATALFAMFDAMSFGLMIAVSLLLAGGLMAVQTATILIALPFALVIVLTMVSLARAVREDWMGEARKVREMRRRMRKMIVP